jgi:hypothetical protein
MIIGLIMLIGRHGALVAQTATGELNYLDERSYWWKGSIGIWPKLKVILRVPVKFVVFSKEMR